MVRFGFEDDGLSVEYLHQAALHMVGGLEGENPQTRGGCPHIGCGERTSCDWKGFVRS